MSHQLSRGASSVGSVVFQLVLPSEYCVHLSTQKSCWLQANAGRVIRQSLYRHLLLFETLVTLQSGSAPLHLHTPQKKLPRSIACCVGRVWVRSWGPSGMHHPRVHQHRCAPCCIFRLVNTIRVLANHARKYQHHGLGDVMESLRHAAPPGHASVRPLLQCKTCHRFQNAGKSHAKIQRDSVGEGLGSVRDASTPGPLPLMRPPLHQQV